MSNTDGSHIYDLLKRFSVAAIETQEEREIDDLIHYMDRHLSWMAFYGVRNGHITMARGAELLNLDMSAFLKEFEAHECDLDRLNDGVII